MLYSVAARLHLYQPHNNQKKSYNNRYSFRAKLIALAMS